MTLNCLIVDDEPLALDLLESYVSRTPFLHLIAQCDSAVKALSVIEEEPIDLVFLDIQMPGTQRVGTIPSRGQQSENHLYHRFRTIRAGRLSG